VSRGAADPAIGLHTAYAGLRHDVRGGTDRLHGFCRHAWCTGARRTRYAGRAGGRIVFPLARRAAANGRGLRAAARATREQGMKKKLRSALCWLIALPFLV